MAKKTKRPRVKKTAAVLTINGPGKMSVKERSDVQKWLYKLADMIVYESKDMSLGRFRAGLRYY